MATGPIDSPRYSKTPEPVLQDFKPINKKLDEIRYDKINIGWNKGFYKRTPLQNLDRSDTVYTKAYFPKRLPQIYDEYLPFFKGFYYIPRDDQIPIRQYIYGIRFGKMPESGNMELYNKKFREIGVPLDFCPKIDPCIYDWCQQCTKLENEKLNKRPHPENPTLVGYVAMFLFLFVISIVITTSLLY